jgi:hypothetical protein
MAITLRVFKARGVLRLDDAISGHLPYEIEMLVYTFERLNKLQASDEVFLINALIESFCVHARNLFEFFDKGARIRTPPRKYAKDGYMSRGTYQLHKQALNQQISHLIYGGRFNTQVGKIDGAKRFSMISDLRTELEHFKNWVVDPLWVTSKWNIPANILVYGRTDPSATNAVTTTTSTSVTFSGWVGPDRSQTK